MRYTVTVDVEAHVTTEQGDLLTALEDVVQAALEQQDFVEEVLFVTAEKS